MAFKKTIALAVGIALFGSSINTVEAQDYCYTGGSGYLEYRSAPCVATSVALSALALGAIIAVAVQHSSHDHGHD